MRSRVACFVLAAVAPLLLSRVQAALIAYEGFDYAPSGANLIGAAGGSGFSGPWRAGGFNASSNANYDLSDDPISFGALLHSNPSISTPAVGAIAGLTRDFASPLGQGGTTAYFSFLVQPAGTLHGGAFNGFFGLVLESAGEPELFIGKPGGGIINRWALEDRGGALQHASGIAPTVGETALLVVKAEYAAAGSDRFTLFVNPLPGGPEPLDGIVKQDVAVGLVQGLTLYSTGAMYIDELRVGETFADVTPVAEPSASALAVLLLLGGSTYGRLRQVARRARG